MGEPNDHNVTIDDVPQPIERTSSIASANSATDLLQQPDQPRQPPTVETKTSDPESRPNRDPEPRPNRENADNFWTSVSCWLTAGITVNSVYKVYGAIFCAIYILLCIMVLIKIKSGYTRRQN